MRCVGWRLGGKSRLSAGAECALWTMNGRFRAFMCDFVLPRSCQGAQLLHGGVSTCWWICRVFALPNGTTRVPGFTAELKETPLSLAAITERDTGRGTLT